MLKLAAETLGEFLGSQRPSRPKAVATATMTGVATAVVTYRLLRSGRDLEPGQADD